MVFGFLSIFKSFSLDVETAKKLLSSYPPQVLNALNLKLEIFFTIYGFFSYLLTFVWLVGAIQAMNLGISVISKEVSGKTADFLLTKPITRLRMLSEKFGAVFLIILLTNIAYTSTAFVAAKVYTNSEIDFRIYGLIVVTLFFIQLFFLSLGFLLGTVIRKIKSVPAVTLPIVFSLFILSAFGGVIGKEEIYYLTPFKYFNSIYIYNNSTYESKYLVVLFAFIAVSILTSFIFYLKKDIEAS